MPGLRPPAPRTSWGRAYEAAFEAVISVVLTMIGGYYADGYLKTSPVFLLLGLALGGAAAMRRLLKIDPGSSTGPQTAEDSSAELHPANQDDPVDQDGERASTGESPGDDGPRSGGKGNG